MRRNRVRGFSGSPFGRRWRAAAASAACLVAVLGAGLIQGCGGEPAASTIAPVAPVGEASPKVTLAEAKGAIAAGSIELAPVADTSIASYPAGVRDANVKDSEQSYNYGKSPTLKIKRQENMALLKFDFSKVPAGATITQAKIILTMANGKAFNHMGVYSVHVDWNEGEGAGNYEDTDKKQTAEETGACYLGPKGIGTKWREYTESDFSHAAAGNGGNATCVSRAKDLGEGKWEVEIDPLVIEAAIADGQTLCLNDETGAWETLSNAQVYSREAGEGKTPVLQLAWNGGRDTTPPSFGGALQVEAGPWPGSLILHLPEAWDDDAKTAAPSATPPAPAVGYRLSIDGKAVPTVEIPRPAVIHRDMFLTGLTPGKSVAVELTAFDEAGNSVTTGATVTTGGAWTKTLAAPVNTATLVPDADAPALVPETYTVRVVDGLTLFDPLTGGLAPQQERKSTAAPYVHTAVRGDIVGMQVLVTLKGEAQDLKGVKFKLSDFTAADGAVLSSAKATFEREYFVKTKEHNGEAWVADVLPALPADELLAIPSQPDLDGQKMAAAYLDLPIPLTTKAGVYKGHLDVIDGEKTYPTQVAILVQDVALPDTLSFVVEMNAYGHGPKQQFWDTYRLFAAHRLSYNALPYGHTSQIDAKVLPLAGEGKDLHVTDWSKYDELYGPLFTGEVAKGLPRDGAPASHWYLPFNEAWPEDLEATDLNKICWEGRVAPDKDKDQKGFKEWLDKSMAVDPLAPDHFSPEWRAGSAAVLKQFIEHAREKGWTKTSLQFFSNHKMYFASGSQSLWVMDEPQYGRDYRALNWLMAFYAKAVQNSGCNFCLRMDISRPGWMGDRIDAGLGLTDSSSGIILDHELVTRRLIATGAPIWWYGGAGDAATDPAAMSVLFIEKWGLGCDGGLPNWTAVGGPGEWDKTGPLRYIAHDPKTGEPVATFRMKACREGQELIELMNQLAHKPGFNRWMVSALAQKQFAVKVVTISKNPDDPGYSTFEGLDEAALARLRDAVVATILEK